MQGTLVILNDVSPIFEAKQQKHENELIEMLVATSTHELRTPLHCIKNTLLMIQKQINNEETKKQIRIALIACEMQELNINDILDYAKCKRNSIALNLESVNLNELLADTYQSFIL